MTPQRFSPIPQFDGDEESAASEAVNHGDHSDAHSRMSEGSRAINRLLLSLWFLLIPMIWPGSDWIGLIILSQAFLVAAKLIQPSVTNTSSAISPDGAVMNVNDEEGFGEG